MVDAKTVLEAVDGGIEQARRYCDNARVIPWYLVGAEQSFTLGCNSSLVLLTGLFAATIAAYTVYNSFGYRKRKALERELDHALRAVCDLEEKLMSLEANDMDSLKQTGREIRLFMDGAFDMMHFGHMNAFRQARALGTYLIAGVNSSETITAAKGAPVCDDDERCATVRGCKWVDEVLPGVPYVMSDEYLNWVIETYKIDYVVHGDDPCIVDGRDCYESAQKMGKYLTIPRTEGVSTTDIVGRMLLLTKDHHVATPAQGVKHSSSHPLLYDDDSSSVGGGSGAGGGSGDCSGVGAGSTAAAATAGAGGGGAVTSSSPGPPPMLASDKNSSIPYFRKSSFLATSRILRLFGAGVKAPKAGDRVVYLAGAWDMFHAGHCSTLEKARELGDYVIVGVHNDYEVNRRRGLNYPIMSLHERVLSVLGCKFVDDVLIDAPYCITEDMVASLKINVVVTGSVTETTFLGGGGGGVSGSTSNDSPSPPHTPPRGHRQLGESSLDDPLLDGGGDDDEEDPFAVPRRMGILKVVQSAQELSVGDFVGRIHLQKEHFDRKFQRKIKAERAHWDEKHARERVVGADTEPGVV